MFRLFNSKTDLMRQLKTWDDEPSHDRFNVRRPGINYDKFPRAIRPRKSVSPVDPSDPCAALVPLQRADSPTASSGLSGPTTLRPNLRSKTLMCLWTSARRRRRAGLGPGTRPTLHPRTRSSSNPNVATDGIQGLAFTFGSWHLSPLPVHRAVDADRHRMRHEYTSLENEAPVAESLEMKEKRSQRAEDAGSALVTCQGFVRASGRYTLVERLPDMGSRIHKHWFVVRDASLKTERLLTMVPQTDTCPMAFTTHTRKTLVELFLALQHPYIYPILDVDFKDCYVLTVLPLSAQGSLKDVIHRSICRDEWRDKYRVRCSGLPLAQIQRIGRQILEALLFLRDRGFPSFGHLHSGNIIIQNGVARLTGFENTLLGYTSRIFPTLRHRVHGESIDSLCFGHVIFEMAAGYELNVAHPTVKNMQDIKCQQTITQLLSFIFDREDGRYPTLEEIAAVDFFRNLDLREMRCSMPPPPFFQTKLSSSVKNLLKEVRRHQRDFWQRKRRSTSVDTTLVVLETTPYCSVADLASPSTSTSNNDRSEEYHTPPDTPTSFPEGSSINNNNGEDEDDDNFGNNNYAGNDNDSLV